MKYQCSECKAEPFTIVTHKPATPDGPNMRCEACGFECRGFIVVDEPSRNVEPVVPGMIP